jgi:hypothetical protein
MLRCEIATEEKIASQKLSIELSKPWQEKTKMI